MRAPAGVAGLLPRAAARRPPKPTYICPGPRERGLSSCGFAVWSARFGLRRTVCRCIAADGQQPAGGVPDPARNGFPRNRPPKRLPHARAGQLNPISQHHLAHQCQWTRPRPRRSGKYSPGSPYEREAIQIAASVRPEPPRNQRQTRRDRTAGQLSVPPFRSSYCEVHMTSIGHEERHNRTTIVELTRPLLPQTGRSRTPHRPSLVPEAAGSRSGSGRFECGACRVETGA